MKHILQLLLVVFLSTHSMGQTYTGPIPKPISGYGSDGNYTVTTQSFPNPNFSGHNIVIYYPSGISAPVPTIFYSHAYGGNDPSNISGFLNFAAGKGYAVVFVPYQTIGVTSTDRYSNLLNGFLTAARSYPNIIDTSKVGFVGHSFGGAASFANAYYCFTALHWGMSGRFILAMAQWYAYNISQADLQSFPTDVKLLTIVYENDVTNDQRMANDVFHSINIPNSEKDYLRVQSDTINGYVYVADHSLPNNSAFDALDYYAYYRLFDALCDYTFNGSLSGKNVALGSGSSNQVSMPAGMRNLIESKNPIFANAESTYQYPCNVSNNPRQSHCNDPLDVKEASVSTKCIMHPNPSNSNLCIESENDILKIEIYNLQGQLVKITKTKNISIGNLTNGLYMVKIYFTNGLQCTQKLVKE
ncbi:MAG: T9SS type A sorting domain-containing protein [Bacteroidetes bacterium]|nr:T9SS type A sorting domain-containing protein [Bacteroidota bacterium]